MDKILKYIFGVLLIVAIVIIGYLVINRTTPLISIDKRVDQRQDQSQYSYQGQILVQNFPIQGNQLKWKAQVFPIDSKESPDKSVADYLNKIPPQYSLFAVPLYIQGYGIIIFTPEFMQEVKK